MRAMILAIAMLAVTLAGCSDDPPTGEFSSSGSAVVVSGNFTAEFQSYENPYAETSGTDLECQQDQVPAPVGDNIEDCVYPFTKVSGHIMELPAGSSYAIYMVDSSYTNPEMEIVTLSGTSMEDFSWDNVDDCDAQMSDDGCNLEDKYDSLEIRIVGSGVPVATADLGASNFDVHPVMMGVKYDATYTGKDLTLTVSGVNETIGVEGWLVTVDENGVKTHAEMVPLTGNGEQAVFKAANTVDSYQQFHIHLAGTSINLATGDVA